MLNKLKLRGIVPPLVTPLLDYDTIDYAGLERLIEHTISGGVHGLFILGTTGEFACLGHGLRKELIKQVCKTVNRRIPVLVGITDSAFAQSLNLADVAAECGADALVLAPPYYFSSGQPEMLEYLERLMIHIHLPLFLYNIPVHTKVKLAPDTIKIAADIPGIIGMKDSSSDLAYLKKVQYALREHPDFTYMIGSEEFMAEFVLTGGHGGVNGGANMFPRLYVRLYEAAMSRDFEMIASLQRKVMQISSTIYQVGNHDSSSLKGIKCSLSVMGICNDFMAEPFHRFRQPERRKIEQMLEELKPQGLIY